MSSERVEGQKSCPMQSVDTMKQMFPFFTAGGSAETLPLYIYYVVLMIIYTVISWFLSAGTTCSISLTPVWCLNNICRTSFSKVVDLIASEFELYKKFLIVILEVCDILLVET